jgi:5-methyltetrahydropteroyltriglutamate--homocysteine methyltransferase
MTEIRFVTREIGSLAKPGWRVKSLAGRRVEEGDVEEARKWGERLGVERVEELTEMLRKGEGFTDKEKREIHDFAALYGIRLLERAGLDVVYDGEQRRSEMYDHVVRHAKGFETRGTVRSFDNKYYTKAAVVEKPLVERAYDLEEFEFVRSHTDRAVKVPFTGSYTILDWSYDEYYAKDGTMLGAAAQRAEARQRFGVDVARNVVRPNVVGLVEAGAEWVQIDEPAATTRPEEVPLVVETFNATREGVSARASMHICFSDYNCLFPHIEALDDCYELQLEFSNRDSKELGTGPEDRPGYDVLERFVESEWDGKVGLGVIDIHTNFIEPPELVRDRVLYAARVLGPERIGVNTDCGLRTRTWEVSLEKLKNMVEGVRLAEKELNGSSA